MYQKIVPHLWFDTEAKEAAAFYTDIFPDGEIISSCVFEGPSGGAEQVTFELMNYRFMSISAGPHVVKNPSISFLVLYTESEMDAVTELWEALLEDGRALVPIGEYPFNKRYGWVEDKYQTSWQFYLTAEADIGRDRIIPSLMFSDDASGQAEQAMKFYLNVFENTEDRGIHYYRKEADYVQHGEAELEGQCFTFQDSLNENGFGFNEGVSLMVNCDSQEEIDYYWDQLTAVPESEECGWLKDQYGVSWQIVPKVMDEMAEEGSEDALRRVTAAFMKMKKFNLEVLERAYRGDES